jgi:hypothetical protein
MHLAYLVLGVERDTGLAVEAVLALLPYQPCRKGGGGAAYLERALVTRPVEHGERYLRPSATCRGEVSLGEAGLQVQRRLDLFVRALPRARICVRLRQSWSIGSA